MFLLKFFLCKMCWSCFSYLLFWLLTLEMLQSCLFIFLNKKWSAICLTIFHLFLSDYLSLNTSKFGCSSLCCFSIKYPKTPGNSLGGPNIWWPYYGYKIKIFGLVAFLLKDSIEVVSFHRKNMYYFFKKNHYLCNSFFCSNLEKTLKNLYCTCEPLLFVKDDNYVDKDYEEANERNIAMRRWGCTFYQSGKIVSHDGSRRHGLPYMWQNKHWKRKIGNMNWHQNSLDGTVSCEYERGTFKWCFWY